jgi:hypothetical protein
VLTVEQTIIFPSALDAPICAPYPVQRGLTALMRSAAQKEGDAQRMQGLGRAVRQTGPGRACREGSATRLGGRSGFGEMTKQAENCA